jgi:hypothetical protein
VRGTLLRCLVFEGRLPVFSLVSRGVLDVEAAGAGAPPRRDSALPRDSLIGTLVEPGTRPRRVEEEVALAGSCRLPRTPTRHGESSHRHTDVLTGSPHPAPATTPSVAGSTSSTPSAQSPPADSAAAFGKRIRTVIATGIAEDGGREVLGLMVRDSDPEVFRRASLASVASCRSTGTLCSPIGLDVGGAHPRRRFCRSPPIAMAARACP